MKNINNLYMLHIKTMQKRTQKILLYSKLDSIIIYSGELVNVFLENSNYKFNTNCYFKSWVPIIDVPYSWLVVDGINIPKLYLYFSNNYWFYTEDISNKFWVDYINLTYVKNINDINNFLFSFSKQNFAYIGQNTDKIKLLNIPFRNINPKKILKFYDLCRLYKTKYELYCIRKAQKIAIYGHLNAFNSFKIGMSEFDININYLKATKQRDFETPYNNIVAINKNTSILHYNKLQKNIPDNIYNFLIDAGASYNGYIADITRSYVVDEKSEFFELLLELNHDHLSSIKTIKPDICYIDYHINMLYKIAKILIKHKFIKNISEDAIIKNKLINIFLPHSLGHSIGLQVHDFITNNNYKYTNVLTKNFILKSGMVLAIEPGIYFIESLLSKFKFNVFSKHFNWNKIDQFKLYGGIRIEDNIIIHNNYIENMTRNFCLN